MKIIPKQDLEDFEQELYFKPKKKSIKFAKIDFLRKYYLSKENFKRGIIIQSLGNYSSDQFVDKIDYEKLFEDKSELDAYLNRMNKFDRAIVVMLLRGFRLHEIGYAFGCTESYISQRLNLSIYPRIMKIKKSINK